MNSTQLCNKSRKKCYGRLTFTFLINFSWILQENCGNVGKCDFGLSLYYEVGEKYVIGACDTPMHTSKGKVFTIIDTVS